MHVWSVTHLSLFSYADSEDHALRPQPRLELNFLPLIPSSLILSPLFLPETREEETHGKNETGETKDDNFLSSTSFKFKYPKDLAPDFAVLGMMHGRETRILTQAVINSISQSLF